MIKIAVIIPYPELAAMAEKLLRDNSHPGIEYEITHAYGTKAEALDIGKPDIIVARGLTKLAYQSRYKNVTVLELNTSAYDILLAIRRCRREYDAKKILVLGLDSLFYRVEKLKELIDVDIMIEKISDETDILAALERGRGAGCDAVVGGMTVCNLARDRGWHGVFIRTSDESFQICVKDAMNTAVVMFTERAKAEIYRSILQNTTEGILYFDRDARLVMYNHRAREMLSLSGEADLSGRGVRDLFADADVVRMVQTGQECHGKILHINNVALLSDFIPVRVEEQTIGIIATFQTVNEIQATETMIRRALNKKGLTAKYGFSDIIHASESMTDCIETAHKYAKVDANVLLVGETGTGKELFAQSIHGDSVRHHKPFVAVNCAAFPENLLESELFGYADGAFSGAARGGKTGLFELAHGGTLFLDEVGEIPLSLQSTLLRVLQEREIRKIGDDRVIPVDVRVIAATNLDLWERVEAGEFRMDLLYRLDVLSLFIPPLRERRMDIALIARHYIRDYCGRHGRPDLLLADDALAALEAYDWPGNARELRNVCERLVVLSDNKRKVTQDVVRRLLKVSASLPRAAKNKDEPALAKEPQSIGALVKYADSLRMKRVEMAKMLGISRTTLWRRMKEH